MQQIIKRIIVKKEAQKQKSSKEQDKLHSLVAQAKKSVVQPPQSIRTPLPPLSTPSPLFKIQPGIQNKFDSEDQEHSTDSAAAKPSAQKTPKQSPGRKTVAASPRGKPAHWSRPRINSSNNNSDKEERKSQCLQERGKV